MGRVGHFFKELRRRLDGLIGDLNPHPRGDYIKRRHSEHSAAQLEHVREMEPIPEAVSQ